MKSVNQIKKLAKRVFVSEHAIDRWVLRTGQSKRDVARKKIIKLIHQSRQVDYVDQCMKVRSIITHGFREAEYYKRGIFVAVVVNNAVVTMFYDINGDFD